MATLAGVRGATHRLRMPFEGDRHERTLMAWPTRVELWGEHLGRAELEYAEVARAVARFEPVTMVTRPENAARAGDLCGPGVEIVELPIDDSWTRDNGPIYVTERRRRVGVDFKFNAWGEKFLPYDDDDRLPERWCARRGEERLPVDLVLEGGSITVDGDGTLITTEQCLLHPNRNPHLTRRQIEERISAALGIDRFLWIPYGLADDKDTDGHVDLVAAFTRPGRILLQGCDDPAEADHGRAEVNRRCLEGTLDAHGRELEVSVIPVLPRAHVNGTRVAVSYLNLYLCNGGVIVPVSGHAQDDDMLALIAAEFPGRELVTVPGTTVAFGGGGPHCITQQIPEVQ